MILEETTPYLESVIIFTTLISILHFYLDFRQLKALKRPNPPTEVKHLYSSPDEFKKKQTYQLDKLRFGMVHSIWDTAINLAFLKFHYFPLTWNLAGSLLANHTPAFFPRGEIAQSISWVVVISVMTTVLGLPWSVYRTFHLEARHGFNKTTPRTFILDIFRSLLLTAILAPPIVAGLVWILIKSGPLMPLYLWTFTVALSLIMMTVYPVFIAPLFNKYDPLPTGPLREKIEALAAELKFPLRKLFVVDGSTRSSHSNAYMYGFFKNKRIVLYDTLLSQCSEEQVVAVLAHELGHWKLKHTPRMFIAQLLTMGVQFGMFSVVRSAPGLYTSFGFLPGQRPALAALLLFQLIIGPVDEVISMVSNFFTRRFEFEADEFGVNMGKGKELKEALCILDRENKGPPNVDALYSAYHFTHPPLPERLRAIDEAMKKST